MTGSGLALPCPVYKYRGMPCRKAVGVCTGASGFAVSRHVQIHFASRNITCLAWSIKVVIYILYAWYVGLAHKSWLDYGHLDGISRLQLQHPVKKCNPLTQNGKGCPTNFQSVTTLPYCSQNPTAANYSYTDDAGLLRNYTPQKCEYYDAFDMLVQGEVPRKTLFVPTRITTYTQEVDCKNQLVPCPDTVKLVNEETIFTADVDHFTVLVDHSFVSDELNVEKNAWSMLGFVNPCGIGSEIDERVFAEARDFLKDKYRSMERARSIACSEEQAHYVPIVTGNELDPKHVKPEVIEQKKRGFAMWLSHWWQTLGGRFTTPSFEKVMEEVKHPSHFIKLENGDFISIKDLLKLAGAELDSPIENNNRFEGIVIILNIEYINVKENSWPNSIPPAYFYSAYAAPMSEYKVMQQAMGMKRFTDTHGKTRTIMDYHGVFVIVKQGGYIGTVSFSKCFVLIFVLMAIDSLYRSLFLLAIFNVLDDRGINKRGEEIELDEKVTLDFKLTGGDREEGYSSELLEDSDREDGGHSS